MVFKRRDKQPLWQKLHDLIWPRMGWKRTFHYYRHRILRLDDSAAKISRGIASGIAVSFTPMPGTHFIQAGLLAWITRGNIPAALVSTFIGNPWTFAAMWYLAYVIGVGIFQALGLEPGELPDHFTLQDLWHALLTDPLHLIVPWIMGGYICVVLIWPAAYFFSHPLILAAKHARHEKKLRRMAEHAARHAVLPPTQGQQP